MMVFRHAFLLVLALGASTGSLFGQADTLPKAGLGQTLDAADSLTQVNVVREQLLREQLDQLRSNDAQARAELEAKLATLQEEKSAQAKVLKRRIDSLRATTPGVPVLLYDDTLFFLYEGIGSFSVAERAEAVSERLTRILKSGYDSTRFQVSEGEMMTTLLYDDQVILAITPTDAKWEGQSSQLVAAQHLSSIKQGIIDYRARTSLLSWLRDIGLILLVLAGLVGLIWLINRLFRWFRTKVELQKGRRIKPVMIRGYELVNAERMTGIVHLGLKVLRYLIIALSLYFTLPIIFSIFPVTEQLSDTLLGYVLGPLGDMWWGFLRFLPDLFTIIVIVIVTRYIVKGLRFLAGEIEEGKLTLGGFYPEWAKPTFNIVKVVIYAFMIVAIFPYLPGSNSPVFQGVSVFLGLIVSLGSSGAISNAVAGLVITYMRPFKIGDRVRFGEVTGDVIEKSLLVTRVRTIKNEEVTVPNATILANPTVNFSTKAQEQGLILHTAVTIGYDVPWRQVHELLMGAAAKTEGVEPQPKPFVLQTSLDDFYVSYELNAYTHQPERMAVIYSGLHQNIQDAFNEAGVEIMSPHYRAPRDGNQSTIPADYLPSDYQTPSFRVENTGPKQD